MDRLIKCLLVGAIGLTVVACKNNSSSSPTDERRAAAERGQVEGLKIENMSNYLEPIGNGKCNLDEDGKSNFEVAPNQYQNAKCVYQFKVLKPELLKALKLENSVANEIGMTASFSKRSENSATILELTLTSQALGGFFGGHIYNFTDKPYSVLAKFNGDHYIKMSFSPLPLKDYVDLQDLSAILPIDRSYGVGPMNGPVNRHYTDTFETPLRNGIAVVSAGDGLNLTLKYALKRGELANLPNDLRVEFPTAADRERAACVMDLEKMANEESALVSINTWQFKEPLKAPKSMTQILTFGRYGVGNSAECQRASSGEFEIVVRYGQKLNPFISKKIRLYLNKLGYSKQVEVAFNPETDNRFLTVTNKAEFSVVRPKLIISLKCLDAERAKIKYGEYIRDAWIEPIDRDDRDGAHNFYPVIKPGEVLVISRHELIKRIMDEEDTAHGCRQIKIDGLRTQRINVDMESDLEQMIFLRGLNIRL